MNVHWMVLYKLYVFYSDMKFKMAATAGLSLTLDPMGKMFQNASSLKPLGQLKPNCPGMIIGRSSVFYADRKSKMAATTGHSINTEPYGENTEIYSSLKLLHWLNLNCASIIGRSFTNFVFFMLIVIPRWLPLQDIVFTLDQLVFFITRWTIQALESLWFDQVSRLLAAGPWFFSGFPVSSTNITESDVKHHKPTIAINISRLCGIMLSMRAIGVKPNTIKLFYPAQSPRMQL